MSPWFGTRVRGLGFETSGAYGSGAVPEPCSWRRNPWLARSRARGREELGPSADVSTELPSEPREHPGPNAASRETQQRNGSPYFST